MSEAHDVEVCACGACIDSKHVHVAGQGLHGVFCQINAALKRLSFERLTDES